MDRDLFLSIKKQKLNTKKRTVLSRFKSKEHLTKLFLSLALTATVLLLLISLLGIKCYLLPVIAVGEIFTFLIWLEWGRKRTIYAILGAIFGFILIGFITENQFSINSVCIAWNAIADTIGRSSAVEFGRFSVSVAESVYPLYTTYLFAMAAALFGVISYLTVSHKQKFFVNLYCLLLAVMSIAFGITPNPIYLSLFVLTYTLILFYHSTERFKISALLIVGSMVLVIGCAYFISNKINKVTEVFETPYTIISEKVKFTENTSDSYGTGQISGNSLADTSETALKITMSEPKPMYLRGFTGATFNGSRWLELDNSAVYDNRELFYLLNKNEFHAFAQLSGINKLINPESVSSEVTVEYVGSGNKYVYLPYEVKQTDNANISTKADIVNWNLAGAQSYSFAMEPSLYAGALTLREENESKLTGEVYSDFDVCEDNYLEYVKETYLDVSSRDRKIIEEIFDRNEIYIDNEIVKDNKKIIKQVRAAINKELSYDKNSSVSLFDRDSIDTILNQNKAGYDIHYATVATLMFRVMGVPARYVEGYIVPINEAVKAKSGEVYYVKGNNAHAWTEIYVNDVGWTPVEVCDEYYSKMFATAEDIVADLGNNSTEAEKEYQQQDKYNNQGAVKINEKTVVSVVIIIIPVCILLFFAVVFIRRTIIIKKRNALLNDKDYNKAILGYYRYFCQVLKSCNLLDDGKNLNELFVTYKSGLDDKEKESLEKLLKIFEKAEYSGKKMKKKDWEITAATVSKNIETITDNQKVFKNIMLYLFVCV